MRKRKFGIALKERKPYGVGFLVKTAVVTAAVCLAAAVGLGVGLRSVKGLGAGDIKGDIFEISDGDQLVECLKKNTTLKDLGRGKSYVLTDCIDLTPAQAEELAYGNGGGSFEGVTLHGNLKGNGHTIRLKEPEGSAEPFYLTAPLIESVEGGGSVEGVTFEGFRFRAQKGSGVALVGINNGSLKDLRLRGTEILIPREEAHNAPDGTAVSALCVYNFGSIANVVADALYHTTDINEKNSENWNCGMGTLVAANEGGQVTSSIVSVSFDTPFPVLTSDRTPRNTRVGYAVGTWQNESNITGIILASAGGDALYERKAHDFYGFRSGKNVVQRDFSVLSAATAGWEAVWNSTVPVGGLPELNDPCDKDNANTNTPADGQQA